MKSLNKILATAIFLTFSHQTYTANAAVKTVKTSTITLKAGTRTGLQEVYSWDARCRTVRVKVFPNAVRHGRVVVIRDRFKISKKQSRKCAGKSVSGYRVVFKAGKRKGSTVASYRIKSKALPATYVVRRKMVIK